MKKLFLITISLFIVIGLLSFCPIKAKAKTTYNLKYKRTDPSTYNLRGAKGSRKEITWHVIWDPITEKQIEGYCVESGVGIEKKDGYKIVNMENCTSKKKCGKYYQKYKSKAGKFTAILNHSVPNLTTTEVRAEFNAWCLKDKKCRKELKANTKNSYIKNVYYDSIRTATQRTFWGMQRGKWYACYKCSDKVKKIIYNLSRYFQNLPSESTTKEAKPSIQRVSKEFKNNNWVIKYKVKYKPLKSGKISVECRQNNSKGKRINTCKIVKISANSTYSYYELRIPNQKIYWKITATGKQTTTSSRGPIFFFKEKNQNFFGIGYAKYPGELSSVSQSGTIAPSKIPCDSLPTTKPINCESEMINGVINKGYSNETIERLLGEDRNQYVDANTCEQNACSGDLCCNTTIDLEGNNLNNFAGDENEGFAKDTWLRFVETKDGVTNCSDSLIKIKVTRTCYSKSSNNCVKESSLTDETKKIIQKIETKFKYKPTSKSEYTSINLKGIYDEPNYSSTVEKNYCKTSSTTTVSYKFPEEIDETGKKKYKSPDGCQGFKIPENPDPEGKLDIEIEYDDKKIEMEETNECVYPNTKLCKVPNICEDPAKSCEIPCDEISTNMTPDELKEKCEPICEGTEQSESAITMNEINYRTISLTDVFPNNRTPKNTNWSAADILIKDGNKYQISNADKIYSGTPEYSVTLNAQQMKAIREYNNDSEKNPNGYFTQSKVNENILKNFQQECKIEIKRNGDQQ